MGLILFPKDEVKQLITQMYEPANMLNKEFRFTTMELTLKLMNILPRIDDNDVYEALVELGFKPEEEATLEYYWYFKRKTDI
ncbi:MAG: hypothetical protein RLZZ540_271 [Bacteroidota bacterium]|jgi:hypothetical protein